MTRTGDAALPNGRLPESHGTLPDDPAALRRRVRDLEALCAEVYDAAVELGLPRAMLNRLWTVAAQGRSPHAFDLEMPPRVSALPVHEASPALAGSGTRTATGAADPPSLPDIRLTDRRSSRDARDARSGRTSPALADIGERRRVLVVDDDPIMLDVLVRILSRENFELIAATSGPGALSQAAVGHGPIDLLVTDYAMPDMQGRELAARLRERDPGLRVLYETGFSDMLFEDWAELEEGSSFLEKPFTARGLREAVRFSLFGTLNPGA